VWGCGWACGWGDGSRSELAIAGGSQSTPPSRTSAGFAGGPELERGLDAVVESPVPRP